MSRARGSPKGRRLFKILTVVLGILLAVETTYLFAHRSASAKRFRRLNGNEVIALDTATGRLCKAFPTKPSELSDNAVTLFWVSLPECSDVGLFSRLRPADRFQVVHEEQFGGRVAWDNSAGRLCRTVTASLIEAYTRRKVGDEAAIGTNAVAEGANRAEAIKQWRLEHPESEDLTFAELLPACWK